MKTKFARLLLLSAAALVVVAPSAFGQRQLGKKKGPTSKIYLAEAIGDSQIQAGDKIYTARQATAFDAPGTVIETSANSRTALVYSNGVGMVIGENSRLEVVRFDQAPFSATTATKANDNMEPSTSQSELFLSRGTVGISTSQFLTGSSMALSTAFGQIKIRGGNIAIESKAGESIFDLLDGAATVITAEKDNQSYVMLPGERLIIRRTPGGKTEVFVTQIPAQVLSALTAFVSIAANSRTTVTFEVIEQNAARGPEPQTRETAAGSGTEDTQEIVPKPTVPASPPINVVISPDRLPGN